MKVWFFKETWHSSTGWKNVYYAVVAQNCYLTFAGTLAEAIYMVHDLIAGLSGKIDTEKLYDEPFEYLNDGIFETDARNTRQHARFEMLWRAFRLTYKNFSLEAAAYDH